MGIAFLGVALPKVLAQEPETRGIVVEAVEKGSAGHKAGILPGDVLHILGAGRLTSGESFSGPRRPCVAIRSR